MKILAASLVVLMCTLELALRVAPFCKTQLVELQRSLLDFEREHIAMPPERLGDVHTANGVSLQTAAAVLGQSLLPAGVAFVAEVLISFALCSYTAHGYSRRADHVYCGSWLLFSCAFLRRRV